MSEANAMFLLTVMGVLGGLAHVFIDAKSWEDLKKFTALKNVVVSAIVGFLYGFLHSDWGFPDGVMAFVSGYTGADFILGLVEKYRKKGE